MDDFLAGMALATLDPRLIAFIVAVVIVASLGFLGGKLTVENQAKERGYIYYCPNGDKVWKDDGC